MSTTASQRPSGSTPATPGAPAPRSPDQVPGWLKRADEDLFTWMLTEATREPGDLLEIGVFKGRTAIHIGNYRRDGEQFTVCDLFDLARADTSIRPSTRTFYKDLTQDEFVRNYLAFHDQPPKIVRAHSHEIDQHIRPRTLRFAHIDGSHLYEHVIHDLLTVRDLMQPNGIVVFDDYRTEHCPGTAAAVWEGVISHGLRIVAVTANKFYGTWGDAEPARTVVRTRVAEHNDRYRLDVQTVLGQQLLRLIPAPKAAARRRPTPTRSDRWRRRARAVLPSKVVEILRTWRWRRRPGGTG